MDINSTAISTATVKPVHEAQPDTPTRIHLSKPLSVTNGVLKRHHPQPPQPPQQQQPFHVQTVSYKECLKNHAASLGGHALDGCGEFMTSPGSVPTDPTSLKCAACGCHRNFHRRDPEDSHYPGLIPAQHVIEYQPHHRHHPPPPPHRGGGARSGSQDSPSPPPISSSFYPSAPHMLLALSAGISGGGAAPHPENPGPVSNGRKRFRTKFTQEQKERMHEFAEKVGWKMQKRDEDLMREFCSEVGVERGVLKVWMHNNKSTLGKNTTAINGGNTSLTTTTATTATTTTQYHIQINNDNENNLAHQFHDHRTVVAPNGSSSSS